MKNFRRVAAPADTDAPPSPDRSTDPIDVRQGSTDEPVAAPTPPDLDRASGETLPTTVVADSSTPFDDGVVRALATGSAPGPVIEQAANAVRLLCPDRGTVVWYRRPDGTATVQAAGVRGHLVAMTGDPDSSFWRRARTEEAPNYRITFRAHPDDTGPTSVWCVPTVEGPASGEVTMVVVGSDDEPPPAEDVRNGLEHVVRLVGLSVDRASLVARLGQGQDRPNGPSPTADMGSSLTSGDADEPQGTVLFYVELAQVKDFAHLHGQSAGEDLITAIGKRLSTTVRPGDTVARMSDMVQAVRCHGVSAIQAESIVARLLSNLWEPVVTRWEETRLRPRVGIARATEPTPLSHLVKDAEGAAALADKAGRDWLWAGQEVDLAPVEPGPAQLGNGFGAGRD